MRSIYIAILIFYASAANAAPVVWTVEAEFNDGTSISGYFTYDAVTQSYALDDFECWLGGRGSGSQPGCPTEVVTEHSWGYSDCREFAGISCINSPATAGNELTLTAGYSHPLGDIIGSEWGNLYMSFSAELTDAGGVINIQSGRELRFNDTGEQLVLRSIVSGQVSAVPIPAAVWLFGSALAGLGWIRRKQVA
jgi:hypothetical protein